MLQRLPVAEELHRGLARGPLLVALLLAAAGLAASGCAVVTQHGGTFRALGLAHVRETVSVDYDSHTVARTFRSGSAGLALGMTEARNGLALGGNRDSIGLIYTFESAERPRLDAWLAKEFTPRVLTSDGGTTNPVHVRSRFLPLGGAFDAPDFLIPMDARYISQRTIGAGVSVKGIASTLQLGYSKSGLFAGNAAYGPVYLGYTDDDRLVLLPWPAVEHTQEGNDE